MPNSSLERVLAHRPARAWRPPGRYPTAGRQSSPSDRRVTCFGTARVVTVIPNSRCAASEAREACCGFSFAVCENPVPHSNRECRPFGQAVMCGAAI